MDPVVALLPHAIILILLLVASWLGRRAAFFAALPVVDAALLTVYVFSEDTYRRGGITRWDAYRSPGGALGPLFIASIVFLVGCAALLAYAALRGRDGLFRVTSLLCAAGGFLVVGPVIIGFSTN